MAIGLYPKYTARYPLDGLSAQQALVLILESTGRMNWRIHQLDASGFVAASMPWIARVAVRVEGDAIELSSTSVARELWDRGRNKDNITRLIETISKLRTELSPEYLTARHEELQHFLPSSQADSHHSAPGTSSAAADIFAIFTPAKGYFITPLILNLNLAIFLLMVFTGADLMDPDSRSLIAWGANLRVLTLGGEWWRLITCCFVHIGALHLLMNMYAFLLIGAQLEPRLGRSRFLLAYLLSGIAASAWSLWWHENNSISAGASGAIFGMYGVFLTMLNTKLVEKGKRKQLLASVIFFVGYNLLGGMRAGIDNAAHLGGLVAGVLISACFLPGLRRQHARNSSDSEGDASQPTADGRSAPVQDDYYP